MLAGYPFSEDSSDSEEPKRGLFEDSESTESDELDSQVEFMRDRRCGRESNLYGQRRKDLHGTRLAHRLSRGAKRFF